MLDNATTSDGRSQADVAYDVIKEMTINFDIKPGQRMNEIELSKQFKLSRTPLREALNRLASERLLERRSAKGFFCRELDQHQIADLYELRRIHEIAAVKMACERASDEALEEFRKTFQSVLRKSERMSDREILKIDEDFHLALARLSRNAELVASLNNINERIRFIRLVDLEGQVDCSDEAHVEIFDAVVRRDAEQAEVLMDAHVSKRSDEIVASIKEGLARIYLKEMPV